MLDWYLLQNSQLLVEARAARTYRDELDALRERAIKADKLESEVGRYREQLHKIEFYKAKVEVRPLSGNFQMNKCATRKFGNPTYIITFIDVSGAQRGQQGAARDQRGAGGPAFRMESTLR